MRNNKVTISTIAEKAGTSKMTVSRVLNKHPYVSHPTRSKILTLIKKFGYHPNLSAVNLSRRSSQTLALVISYEHIFTTNYFIEILQGIEKAISLASYNLIIFNYSSNQEIDMDKMIEWYYGSFIKGFLLLAPPRKSPLVKKFKTENIPFILIGAHYGFKDINYIDVDNEGGAYKATEFLINLGHKKIGFIAGPPERGDALQRELGFRRALKNYGHKYNPSLTCNGEFTEHKGYQAMAKLLQQDPRPTAVFAANDLMAKGAMSAVRDSGLVIPKDISIVGFDDINIAVNLSPSLTTVKQPIFRLGLEAVDFLIKYSEGQKGLYKKILPVELMIRESCARLWPLTKI